MKIDSSKIVFENPDDLIDFVTRGIPPTGKQYEEFKDQIRHAPAAHVETQDGQNLTSMSQDSFRYSEDLDDAEFMEKILDRAYTNQCRNRNITIGAVIGFFVLGIIGGSKYGEYKTEKEMRSKM